MTYINNETGKAFIQLRRRMKDVDAANVARIRFDDFAYAQTRGIYDSILKNRSDNGQSSSVEAYPPFTQSRIWTALGKEIQFDFREPERERQFLVYELLTCAAAFPFSELWFDRDNDGRSQVNPETPEEYFAKLEAYKSIARDADRIQSDEPQGGITNDNEPSLDYPEYEVINATTRFLDLRNKEVEKLPQNRTTHRAAQNKTRPYRTDEPESYSTGEGSYKDVTTAPFAITLPELNAMMGDEIEEIEGKDRNRRDEIISESNPNESESRRRNFALPADF